MKKCPPVTCKDCGKKVFSNVNMVMLKDSLWQSICDYKSDVLCDCCIEKRMGRKIVIEDFRPSMFAGVLMIPCNAFWLEEQKRKNKCLVCEGIEKYSGPETGGWDACVKCGTI